MAVVLGTAALLFTGSASAADPSGDWLAAAQERLAALTGEQTTWAGPESGPPVVEGARVVFVSLDQQNPTVKQWADTVVAIGDRLGWEVTVIDARGTADGQLAAFNQAIALQPDGIISGAVQAADQQQVFEAAAEAGIPVTGIHAAAQAQGYPELGLAWNAAQDTQEIGRAAADFAIVDSAGEARVIVLTDTLYEIARAKADAEEDWIVTQCPGCTMLEYVNSPLSEVAQRIPQEVSGWIARHGTPFYVLTVADYYYDFVVPALRDLGVSTDDVKLVGADGTPAAYQRIRDGDYQVATVPSPVELEAFIAVDALNRVMSGEEPAPYVAPVKIVTAENVDAEGGAEDTFVPANDYAERYYSIWGVNE